MRSAFCESMMRCSEDPGFVFLTGDLGFGALEPLRERAGSRFINAGIAEQNMVSAAAGLAAAGLQPWVYSIAPFVYARPYEQIRNDVCLHDLPVRLVGNGGGYSYGVMGATHHALEDYGSLLCLQNMHAFLPVFRTDIPALTDFLAHFKHPAYLRLGRDECPVEYTPPDYAAWRLLLEGSGPTVLAAGPIAGALLSELLKRPTEVRPELWIVSELPLKWDRIPDRFFRSLKRTNSLFVVEEHVAQGSVGQSLAHLLLLNGRAPSHFRHCHAVGYPSGRYGSQAFHRSECGLDSKSLAAAIMQADFP